MLVALKDILEEAFENRTAVGAFNTVNLSSVRAVIDAAEALKQPVILQHAQIHESIAPLKVMGPVMLEAAQKAEVPVCVHLDHGEDIDYLLQAIEMGFTSVMYDGSKLPYDENLANTRAVVEAASPFKVSVEAELGRVLRPEGGEADESEEETDVMPEDLYTRADEAKGFVEASGIDALAIAFGTAHGVYTAEPKLDFDRVREIRMMTKLPLVMHGGSGVHDEDFKRAIQAGITKVNYFTYMSMAGGEAVRRFISDHAQRNDLRFDEMAEVARQAMENHVRHAIKLFSGLC